MIIIDWIKPNFVTWRDWWASRTNKAISVLLAVYLSIQNGLVSLTYLGVPETWENAFMSGVGLLVALGLFKLRAVTDRPLAGRSFK